MVSKEQIQSFFAKQCTDEETAQVASWLQAHPADAAIYLDEVEWQNASPGEPVSENFYTESWQQIHRKIKTSKRYNLLKCSAVAACIAGCIATGIFYINKNGSVPAAVSSPLITASITQAIIVDTIYNLTNQPRCIVMADGSIISLSPKFIVWFDTPFAGANARDIDLTGEARFEVAKNKLKPFTVCSGSFSATALGTGFIVKEQPDNTWVQLMHGKVVIKNTDHPVKSWENVYLLPGQQMIFNDRDALAKVSSIAEQKIITTKKLTAKNITQRETAGSLIFNGSPMNTVLRKLHDYYRADIQFTDDDIKNISFAGVIVKKDSVQTILKAITQMNGLLVEGSDSVFIILKENN